MITYNLLGGGISNSTSKQNFIIIILLIGIGILIYDMIKSKIPDSNIIIQTSPSNNSLPPPPPTMARPPLGKLLRDYDYRTYNDDLTPPFKRDDYMVPPQLIYPSEFGLYTRGMPGTFRKMGYLKNLDVSDNKFLTLMGRQKYAGSTQYEYYVTSTNKDENLKFYLNKNKRELYDGDTVSVPQLNDRQYEVIIDKNLDYEYIPYI